MSHKSTQQHDLKPCPFCNQSAVNMENWYKFSGDSGVDYWVECTSCKSRSGYGIHQQEATDAWNRRSCPNSPCNDLLLKCADHANP